MSQGRRRVYAAFITRLPPSQPALHPDDIAGLSPGIKIPISSQSGQTTFVLSTIDILCLSVSQSRLHGGIMFSTCPFVRPSVSIVRLLPTCERYTSKTNEPISMEIGTDLSWGKGMNGRLGVRRSKIKVTGG